jgi:hypothetical protein
MKRFRFVFALALAACASSEPEPVRDPESIRKASLRSSSQSSVLRKLAEDPSLAGDEARLKSLVEPRRPAACTTEFSPTPQKEQAVENQKLLESGYEITGVGWDPSKRVYILYWSRR